MTVESEMPQRMLKAAVEFNRIASEAERADADVNAPLVVNYAFSIEVYLKLLLLLTTRRSHQAYMKHIRRMGHNLFCLFNALDEAIREKVLSHYPGTCDDELLENMFVDYAKAFEEWRYAYEREALCALMGELRNLPLALHATVREMKPDLVSDYEKAEPH